MVDVRLHTVKAVNSRWKRTSIRYSSRFAFYPTYILSDLPNRGEEEDEMA